MAKETSEVHKRLVALIRKLAKKEISEALDQHLTEYQHQEAEEEFILDG